jgi:hypothetical protein
VDGAAGGGRHGGRAQELGVRLSLASLLERTTAAVLALAAEELLLDELERELAAAR